MAGGCWPEPVTLGDEQSSRQGLGAGRSGGTGLPAVSLSPAGAWGGDAGAGRHLQSHQLSPFLWGRAISGWGVVWRRRCSPKCLFFLPLWISGSCKTYIQSPVASRGDRRCGGSSLSFWLLSVKLPLHPSHCCSSRRSRMGHGWAVTERSSWVEEMLAQEYHPSIHSSTSWPVCATGWALRTTFICPFPPEPGLAHLCNAALGPSLEHASSSTHPKPHFPPYLSPSPRSPTHKMPVWLMYICMVLFFFFFFIRD